MKNKNKLIFLMAMLCLNLWVNAQTGNPYLDTIRQKFLSVTNQPIPTGVLMDLTPMGGTYPDFRGLITDSIGTVSDFRQAILNLKNASLNYATLPTMEELSTRISFYQDQGKSAIGIIDYRFNSINDSAFIWGVLQYDTITEKVIFMGNPNNKPWLIEERLYMTVILNPLLEDSINTFVFASDLLFTNIEETRNLQIDFGTQIGIINFPPNLPINIDLSNNSEEQLLDISIKSEFMQTNYTGFQKLQKKSEMEPVGLQKEINTMSLGNPCFNFMGEQIGDARIYIQYSNRGIPILKKPFIFIEGFDMDNNHTDMRYGDVGYRTLAKGETFNEDGDRTRLNLTALPILAQRLRNEGFDIIMIDFRWGAQDLRINGNAVIKVIQWVNENKTTNEPLIVMGASNGGSLARYAIRKMELQNCNHCVKLYGTFDTPHQGVTIPLGIQDFVKHINNSGLSDKARLIFDEGLQSPAARQMLIENVLERVGTPDPKDYKTWPEILTGRNLNDPMHVEWQAILNTLGYPQHCRRIAITNGNPNGFGYNYGDNSQLIRLIVKKDILFKTITFGDFIIKSEPNCISGNCMGKVYDGFYKTYTGHKVGKIEPYFREIRKVGFIELTGGASSRISRDDAPGGGADWLVAIEKMTMNNGLKKTVDFTIKDPNFNPNGLITFVPIISALDMNGVALFANIKSLIPIDDRIKKSSLHPFDAIHYQNKTRQDLNDAHVFIDQTLNENIDFIVSQALALEKPLDVIPTSNGDNTFNYGVDKRQIHSIEINNGGKVQFNGQYKNNYQRTNDFSPNNFTAGQTYEFETNICENVYVKVNNGGVMMLGDTNTSANGNNKAIAYFKSGSTLEITNNGILHVHNGSKLVIDEGATLIYKTGARIILDGDVSDIEIKGKIMLENGATFSVEKGSSYVNGRLILVKTTDNSGRPIRNSSSATTVNITGSNINDQLLILKGGTIEFNFLGTLNMSTGIVLVDDNSRLYLTNNDINIHHIVFKPLQSNPVNAVGLDIKNERSTSLVLANNSFSDLTVGLALENDNYTTSIKIEYSTFYRCNTGILSHYNKFNLEHCLFSDCGKGISADLLSLNSEIKSCHFENNDIGAEILPLWYLDIYSNENLFNLNNRGISANNYTRITMHCNKFIANYYGIFTSGELNLSPLRTLNGNTGYDNTFYNNSNGIYLDNGELYLENGENNFYSTLVDAPPYYPNHNFITGSIMPGSNCLDINNKINSTDNYWYPVPLSGSIATAGSQYYSLSPVSLIGNMLTNLNTTCFSLVDDGEAYSDNGGGGIGKKEKNVTHEEYLKIVPNPSSSKITLVVSTNSESPAIISIIDYHGKEIQKLENQSFTKGTNVRYFDLSYLAKGLYTIAVHQNNKITTERLILQ